jgi:hypothetical protein
MKCPRHVRPIHLSFAVKWSTWSVLAAIRKIWLASSNRRQRGAWISLLVPESQLA